MTVREEEMMAVREEENLELEYRPQYTLITALSSGMKENKDLLAFAIQELINKTPENNTIKSINTSVVEGKEVIKVVSE